MAIRIPVIERQASIPADSAQPRVSPERAGAGAGQLADAAFGFARQAIAIDQQIREQRDVIDVSRALADARLHWVRRSSELEQEAAVDGAGHEQRLTKEFGDYQAAAAERLSPTARGAFGVRLEQLQSQMLGRAIEFERGRRVAATVNAFADAQRTSLAAVYQDAAQFEGVIGDLTGTIKANEYLPADKKDELLRGLQTDAAVALLSGLIDRGQLNTAKSRLASGQFNLALGPRGLNAMNDQLQRAFDRQEARAAAAERSRLAQLAVSVRAGIRDDLAAADQRGSGAGQGGAWLVPDAQIRAVYSPEQADDLIERRDAAVALHTARAQLRTASPEEMQKILQDAAPTEGAGFAAKSRRYRALLSAAGERQQALVASPGDYVVANDQAVAAAFATAQDDPAQLERAAQLSLQVQERLGVPPERREVLGKARAAQIAGKYNSATPDEVVRAMGRDGLPQQFGAQWPRVFGELQRAGLTGAAIALPLVSDPVVATNLATATRVPVADLKQAVTPDATREVNKALDDALVPLQRSLGRAPDGTQRGNDLRDAVTRLALLYVQRGQPPVEAAKAAYEQVISQQWDFDTKDFFRVQKRHGTAADARKAVEVMLRLTDADALATPPAGSDAAGKLPDQERRKLLLQQLRQGEYQIATNETDTGLVLLDRSGTPLRDARGQRLEIGSRHFQLLIAAGRALDEDERQATQAQRDEGARKTQEAIRRAASAAVDAVTTRSSETFAERFRKAMRSPSASWLPSGPLTEPIDLLDVLRRAVVPQDVPSPSTGPAPSPFTEAAP